MKLPLNKFQLSPVMDANGKPWIQRCYVCDRAIDFKKDPHQIKWLRVDKIIRHRKCFPGLPPTPRMGLQ